MNESQQKPIRVSYPYEEFRDDFYSFLESEELEREAFEKANGTEVEPSFMRTSFFLTQFMAAREPDPGARVGKALAIFLVAGFIVGNAEALDVGNHLVKGQTAILFSNHLVEATFRHFFPEEISPGAQDAPDPEDVLRLANQIEAEDS